MKGVVVDFPEKKRGRDRGDGKNRAQGCGTGGRPVYSTWRTHRWWCYEGVEGRSYMFSQAPEVDRGQQGLWGGSWTLNRLPVKLIDQLSTIIHLYALETNHKALKTPKSNAAQLLYIKWHSACYITHAYHPHTHSNVSRCCVLHNEIDVISFCCCDIIL